MFALGIEPILNLSPMIEIRLGLETSLSFKTGLSHYILFGFIGWLLAWFSASQDFG